MCYRKQDQPFIFRAILNTQVETAVRNSQKVVLFILFSNSNNLSNSRIRPLLFSVDEKKKTFEDFASILTCESQEKQFWSLVLQIFTVIFTNYIQYEAIDTVGFADFPITCVVSPLVQR
jgi:hypothetical protein